MNEETTSQPVQGPRGPFVRPPRSGRAGSRGTAFWVVIGGIIVLMFVGVIMLAMRDLPPAETTVDTGVQQQTAPDASRPSQ
jgi:hypothetical protein